MIDSDNVVRIYQASDLERENRDLRELVAKQNRVIAVLFAQARGNGANPTVILQLAEEAIQ